MIAISGLTEILIYSGLDGHRLILDSKPEWEFWKPLNRMNIICIFKDWMVFARRKNRRNCKNDHNFPFTKRWGPFYPMNLYLSCDWPYQWETSNSETCLNLENICSCCSWNILSSCKWDQIRLLYERDHVVQWCLLLNHHSANLLKHIYWADQKLTTDE